MRRLFVLLLVPAGMVAAEAGAQKMFPTPADAATTLLASLQSGDYTEFLSVAGPRMAAFWDTGDPERDVMDRDRLLDAARRCGLRTAAGPEGRRLVYVGDLTEPFPAPLVETDAGWRFDGETGGMEVTARRIRRNEIAIVEMLLRFREAEFLYRGLGGAGDPAFAQRIRSTPGQHDGLFWNDSGEDESPLGPAFAAAAFAEDQPAGGPRPLFGYFVRILYSQGSDAPGGALDYHTNGRLRKGFAVIAWPANYGVDGVRSFLVNHFGYTYQKDMGPNTAHVAATITVFNPDRSWSRFDVDE